MSQLCELVSLSEDTKEFEKDGLVPEDEVMLRCRSFVRRSPRKDGQAGLEFAHYTVREYLETVRTRHPSLHRYEVSSEIACELMAILCLRCLTLENQESLLRETPQDIARFVERAQVGSVYQHAAMYWPRYVQGVVHHSVSLDESIRRLLAVQKTPSFTAWAFEMLRHYADKPAKSYAEFCNDDVVFDSLTSSSRDIFAAVVNPNFSPLHMAAAMGMARICQALLREGAALDRQSKFSTPLHCAAGGMGIFLGEEYEPDEYNMEWLTWVSLDDQMETLQVLLMAGANVNLQVRTPFRQASLIHLGANQSDTRRAFEIAACLISAGARLKDEDVRYFDLKFEVLSDLLLDETGMEPQDAEAVIKLAVVLDASVPGSLQVADYDLEKELLSMTRCFIEEMRLVISRLETPQGT